MTAVHLPRSICVCEPQCQGFEHGPTNAAILHTVLLAFPDAEVTFAAEQEHGERVRTHLLTAYPDGAARVRWESITIPPRLSRGVGRLTAESHTLWQIFSIASAHKADLLFFDSVADLGLLALKIGLLVQHRSFKTLVMVHSLMESFESSRKKRFSRFRGLPAVFSLPHPPGLRFIALGESIFRHLQAIHPQAARWFDVLDLPHEWATSAPQQVSGTEPVRFGFLGVSQGKGFPTFAKVITGVRDVEPSAQFSLVGHLNSAEDCMRYAGLIADAECKPLSDEEYRRRGMALTYAVWTADPDHYRLVASASFLDALSLAKPCIYLHNPFIDSYALGMGDIGYGCGSVQEMQDLIISLIRSFPVERYREQCATILRSRDLFSPGVVSERLRALVMAYPKG